MEKDLIGRHPQWTMTSMKDKVNDEDNFNGRQL